MRCKSYWFLIYQYGEYTLVKRFNTQNELVMFVKDFKKAIKDDNIYFNYEIVRGFSYGKFSELFK